MIFSKCSRCGGFEWVSPMSVIEAAQRKRSLNVSHSDNRDFDIVGTDPEDVQPDNQVDPQTLACLHALFPAEYPLPHDGPLFDDISLAQLLQDNWDSGTSHSTSGIQDFSPSVLQLDAPSQASPSAVNFFANPFIDEPSIPMLAFDPTVDFTPMTSIDCDPWNDSDEATHSFLKNYSPSKFSANLAALTKTSCVAPGFETGADTVIPPLSFAATQDPRNATPGSLLSEPCTSESQYLAPLPQEPLVVRGSRCKSGTCTRKALSSKCPRCKKCCGSAGGCGVHPSTLQTTIMDGTSSTLSNSLTLNSSGSEEIPNPWVLSRLAPATPLQSSSMLNSTAKEGSSQRPKQFRTDMPPLLAEDWKRKKQAQQAVLQDKEHQATMKRRFDQQVTVHIWMKVCTRLTFSYLF